MNCILIRTYSNKLYKDTLRHTNESMPINESIPSINQSFNQSIKSSFPFPSGAKGWWAKRTTWKHRTPIWSGALQLQANRSESSSFGRIILRASPSLLLAGSDDELLCAQVWRSGLEKASPLGYFLLWKRSMSNRFENDGGSTPRGCKCRPKEGCFGTLQSFGVCTYAYAPFPKCSGCEGQGWHVCSPWIILFGRRNPTWHSYRWLPMPAFFKPTPWSVQWSSKQLLEKT